MKKSLMIGVMAVAVTLVSTPLLADQGKGRGHDVREHQHEVFNKHHGWKRAKNGERHHDKHDHFGHGDHRYKNMSRHDYNWKAHKSHNWHSHIHNHNGVRHQHRHIHNGRMDHHWVGHRPYRGYYSYHDSNGDLITGLLIGGVIGHILTDNDSWEH